MMSTTDEWTVTKAREVADHVFHTGARYVREADVTLLANGFHILDKEAQSGD